MCLYSSGVEHFPRKEKFAIVYVLALVISLAVWFFYRAVYEDDTSFLVPIVISLATSYVAAHALTGGRSPRN